MVHNVLDQLIASVFLMGSIMIRVPLGTTLVRDVGVGITVLFVGQYAVLLLYTVLQTIL